MILCFSVDQQLALLPCGSHKQLASVNLLFQDLCALVAYKCTQDLHLLVCCGLLLVCFCMVCTHVDSQLGTNRRDSIIHIVLYTGSLAALTPAAFACRQPAPTLADCVAGLIRPGSNVGFVGVIFPSMAVTVGAGCLLSDHSVNSQAGTTALTHLHWIQINLFLPDRWGQQGGQPCRGVGKAQTGEQLVV